MFQGSDLEPIDLMLIKSLQVSEEPDLFGKLEIWEFSKMIWGSTKVAYPSAQYLLQYYPHYRSKPFNREWGCEDGSFGSLASK